MVRSDKSDAACSSLVQGIAFVELVSLSALEGQEVCCRRSFSRGGALESRREASPRLCGAARTRRPTPKQKRSVCKRDRRTSPIGRPLLTQDPRDRARVLRRSWPPAPPQSEKAEYGRKGGLYGREKQRGLVGGGEEAQSSPCCVFTPRAPKILSERLELGTEAGVRAGRDGGEMSWPSELQSPGADRPRAGCRAGMGGRFRRAGIR